MGLDIIQQLRSQVKLPNYSGINYFMNGLEYSELNKVLEKWMSQYMKGEDIWMSIDGKVLGSTVTNSNNSAQNYKSIVSMFIKEKGIILTTKGYENKKENEIQTARDLIETLEIKGITMTLDALHCQKKRRKVSWWEEMTM